MKACLAQHGVVLKSELYGRTAAFRLVLQSAEAAGIAGTGQAPAAAASAGRSASGAASSSASTTAITTFAKPSHVRGVERKTSDTQLQRREILSELIRREGALPPVVMRSFLQSEVRGDGPQDEAPTADGRRRRPAAASCRR